MNILLAILAVFLIIFFVPLPVYFLFTRFAGLEEPENPQAFFLSVIVQKTGIAIGFVLLFVLSRDSLIAQWPVYALLWFIMYAIIEIGQALGPQYRWKEAAAGIIAEAIYFPLAAFATVSFLA